MPRAGNILRKEPRPYVLMCGSPSFSTEGGSEDSGRVINCLAVCARHGPTHIVAPKAQQPSLTPLTCASDKCHKIFQAFSLAKFPFSQGGTVAIIVHPHWEMQSIWQGGPEVHRVPFLNQFGWMQHNSFLRIYTATRRNTWAPPQTRVILIKQS